MLAGTAACTSMPMATGSGQGTRPAVDVFRASGEALVQGLKGLLRGSDGAGAIDVQTAITMEIARMPALQVADRRRFQDEADLLDELIAEADRPAPVDSAVLAYLANLSNGQSASASYLSESEERTVLALCGPAHEVMRSLGTASQTKVERLLRQSCFTWLVGDLEKSNALFYLATARGGIPLDGADNGFEAFLHRFEGATGTSLLAHRNRLQGGDGKAVDGVARRGGTPDPHLLSTSSSAP